VRDRLFNFLVPAVPDWSSNTLLPLTWTALRHFKWIFLHSCVNFLPFCWTLSQTITSSNKWRMKVFTHDFHFTSSPKWKVEVHIRHRLTFYCSNMMRELISHTHIADISISAATDVTIWYYSHFHYEHQRISKRNSGNWQKLHHEHVFKTRHSAVPRQWTSLQCTTVNCLSVKHTHTQNTTKAKMWWTFQSSTHSYIVLWLPDWWY